MRILLIILFTMILTPSPASAQELASILEAHYNAAALERMQKVETIITTGKNSYATAGYESAFRIIQSRPNKLRIEGDYQGEKVIQASDGTIGWKYAPGMGVQEPTEIIGQELETLLSLVQFENPLWNYRERGATLEIVAQEGMTQHSMTEDHLVLTTSLGDIQHFFIDRESHLINSVKTSQPMGGSETEIEVVVEAYKSVKGIPFAHHVITKMNGQVVTTLIFEKVEVNRKIDPSLFEKPVAE